MGGGNPFKKAKKSLKRAAKKVSRETSRATKEVGKVVSSAAAAAQDPGVLATAFATGGLTFAQKGSENYKAMTQAERDANDAEGERRAALSEEARLKEDQQRALKKQAKMAKERDAKAKASAEERATRLGTGRRGLLYQGKETGVAGKSKVLGG